MGETGGVLPNVLASRYAGADLAALWSPEHKVVLERQLWLAVLKAQRDLGVDVPDGVVVDKIEKDGRWTLEELAKEAPRFQERTFDYGHPIGNMILGGSPS